MFFKMEKQTKNYKDWQGEQMMRRRINRKRLGWQLLAVSLVLGAASVPYSVAAQETKASSSEDSEESESKEEYEYRIEDGKAIISSYLGEEEQVSIPEYLDGALVTRIESGAFYGKRSIKTLYIPENIQEIDPANKEDYVENAGKYVDKLNDLDGRYALTISKGKRQAILFGDRFPFRYMADDYGLTYYAAFVGCSAESEAGFETITFLAHKVDELKLPVILTIEGADHNIAESIKNATESKNQEILTMNSMQSVTAEDVADGETYLNVMEDNLNVLSQALN